MNVLKTLFIRHTKLIRFADAKIRDRIVRIETSIIINRSLQAGLLQPAFSV